MNQSAIDQFLLILKQLSAIVATLGTMMASNAGALPAQHFGSSLPPNVNATTSLPAMTSNVPYYSSYDNLAGVYTQASTTLQQNTNGSLTFTSGMTKGGTEVDIATTTYTPTMTQICNGNYFVFNAQAASSTFALPASSTMTSITNCLGTSGNETSFVVTDASTTAAVDVAISNLTNSSSGIKMLRTFSTIVTSTASSYYLRSLSSSTPDTAKVSLFNASGTINVLIQQLLQ